MKPSKVDWATIEREYIFDSAREPVSFTDLAEKHGVARSNLADRARLGRWYEKRQQFRESLGASVVEAFADKWAAHEIGVREKIVNALTKYVDLYVDRLGEEDSPIKPNTRDFLQVVAALRVLMGDAAAAQSTEGRLIDPDDINLNPADLADFISRAKASPILRLAPGDERDDAAELAPTGTEGTGED